MNTTAGSDQAGPAAAFSTKGSGSGAAARDAGPAPSPEPQGATPAPRRAIALIAVAAVALELAFSARYGYVRDELYFMAAGHHLAFGYVDQPPLAPLLARISEDLSGDRLIGLRVLPALSLGAIVWLTAAMSRRLGAGRTGQVLAALAAATCAEYIAAAHELTTTTPDFFFWAVTLYLAVRLLESRDPRWWLPIGLCAGIASEAKWNIAFLAVALVAGLLLTDGRGLLRSRWFAVACIIAAALAAPDVIWQAAHNWPDADVFRVLQTQAGHNRATYWLAQVLFTGLVLTPVWVAGLIWTLRPQARRFRAIGIACGIVIGLQFILGGKAYYAGGAYTFLLAAGSVPTERWLAARWLAAARPAGRIRLPAAMLVSAAVMLPVALPVLPPGALRIVPLQKINYDLGEEIAWPQEVALLAREYRALPAAQRRVTTILTGNYGEAGAVARYGPGLELPTTYSGANNFWLWGPPPAAATSAIAINVDPAFLRREFTRVKQIAIFNNGLGVHDDEEGATIYLATGLKSSWASAWPAFRNYG